MVIEESFRMRIYNWLRNFGKRTGQAVGIGVLAGGMMFAGQVSADTVLSEDFESATQTGPGAAGSLAGVGGDWAAYGTTANYSGDDHTTALGGAGGQFYGHTVGVPANPTATADFSFANLMLISNGATLDLEAWMAGFTGDGDTTTISAEVFDGLGGTGTSLGSISFTDTDDAWSFHTASMMIDPSALSVVLTYGGTGNDTYADNIVLSVNASAIPEPGAFALLGIGGLGIAYMRRRKC